jgi:hypothetical protein
MLTAALTERPLCRLKDLPACGQTVELWWCNARPSKIRRRLTDFYEAVIDANLPEATRLAKTVETWWPAIPGRPHPRRKQRPQRGLQPGDQAD